MSWRTVIIENRCKLDLKMGYLVVRGEETRRVFLDEIALLIIENAAVSLTGCLLNALVERKVRVIFCDGKRNPQAELAPLYGSHDSSRKIKTQISWREESKGAVWTEIVAEKLRRQAEHLKDLSCFDEAEMLKEYLAELQYCDATNREGHAAKVYFNALFGMSFTRSEDCTANAALNYGYSLLLSAFNREVTANGYLTQLGLFHDNMFNFFNLSCDLMEPFRVLVDRKVKANLFLAFGKEEKRIMASLLHEYVQINGAKQTVLNAVKLYTRSVFDAIEDDDVSKLLFYKKV